MNQWFLLAIGLLCVSTVIWFLGPLIVIGGMAPFESGVARLLTIFILVFLWSVNNLLLVYLDRRRSKKITSELTSDGEGFNRPTGEKEQIEREISAMAVGFANAARTLKRVNRGGVGDKRYIYRLPWYLTLGPDGAGKSTALRNAGLGFSLVKQRGMPAQQTRQDDRYCQWWFCDDAVVIDTAGRHTGQNNGNSMVDKVAWQKLLAMLRKYRPQRPINGVILTISMADLLVPDNDVRSTSADAIRDRLQELSLEFKTSIPVYCLFTKCDHIAGFVEYFDKLDRKSKDQVWGFTFALKNAKDSESPLDSFDAKYDRLIERLQTGMIEHLEYDTDFERRARIQEFPTQMQLLRQLVHDQLSDIFKPRRFDGEIELRGVYFTSARQADAPIGRLAQFLSSIFGLALRPLPAFGGVSTNYFLKSLFADVIFRESNLSVYSAVANRRRRLIRLAAAAGAFVTFFAFSFAWLISFDRNQDYISSVEAQVANFVDRAGILTQNVADIRSPLPILDLLRKIPGGYAERDESGPIAAGFGLSQRDKVGSAARAAYQRVLQSTLLPRLIHRLERQLKERFDRPGLLAETLKTYLMLVDPTRFDRETVGRWYSVDVERWLPAAADVESRAALLSHLDALLEQQLTPPPPDVNLVGAARRILAATPLARRAYATIKAHALKKHIGEPWLLHQQLGRVAGRVFDPASTPTVPAFYTVEGYRKTFPQESRRVVKEIVDSAWVIGIEKVDGQLDKVHDEVINLYLAEYADIWDGVLARTRLVPLSSLQQASQVFEDLIGENMMLRRFYEVVGRQTKLSPQLDKKGADRAAKLKSAAKRVPGARTVEGRLSRLRAIGAGAPPGQSDPALRIDKRYAEIHDLVELGADGKTKIDRFAVHIRAFGGRLAAIAKQGYSPQQANWEEIDVDAALPAIRQVKPLYAWVIRITEQFKSLSGGRAKNRINAKWNEEVGNACQETLATSYPFKSDSKTDLPLDEFARFFAPTGLFDRFFKENLEGLVDTSSRPWKPRTDSENNPLISRSAVATFERVASIRRLFFQNGAGPQYSFVLVPVALDNTVSKFQLEIGNQRITYRHGPARSWQLTWPGTDPVRGARVVFTTFKPGNPTASLVRPGAWGWFRMMDRFRVRSKTNLIQFDVKNFKAIYKFDPSHSASLSGLRLFKTFRCPEDL